MTLDISDVTIGMTTTVMMSHIKSLIMTYDTEYQEATRMTELVQLLIVLIGVIAKRSRRKEPLGDDRMSTFELAIFSLFIIHSIRQKILAIRTTRTSPPPSVVYHHHHHGVIVTDKLCIAVLYCILHDNVFISNRTSIAPPNTSWQVRQGGCYK
jgi:hypothetical protein